MNMPENYFSQNPKFQAYNSIYIHHNTMHGQIQEGLGPSPLIEMFPRTAKN